MPFWQFFRKGWDGHTLFVRPSKMHHSIWRTIFVLGANEYLERSDWQAKLESDYSFRLKYFKITVLTYFLNQDLLYLVFGPVIVRFVVLQSFLLFSLRSVVLFISECWYSQNVPFNRQIKLFEVNPNVDNIGAFCDKNFVK